MSNGEDRDAPSPCEAWLSASSVVLSGLHHALNNRVTSVSALAQLLALDAGPAAEQRTLVEEIRRLEDTLRLLRLVPRRSREPIPLHLPYLLPDVLALARHHRETGEARYEVRSDPEMLPVLVEESAAVHALLLLVVEAGRCARTEGNGEVLLRCGGDERWATLDVEVEGCTPAAGVARAAGGILAVVGGEVSAVPGGYRVRFPTLPEARRREREEPPP